MMELYSGDLACNFLLLIANILWFIYEVGLRQTLHLGQVAMKSLGSWLTQGLSVYHHVATLLCSKQDYRQTLCCRWCYDFEVVCAVNDAVAAAGVPISRATEWLDGFPVCFIVLESPEVGWGNKLTRSLFLVLHPLKWIWIFMMSLHFFIQPQGN